MFGGDEPGFEVVYFWPLSCRGDSCWDTVRRHKRMDGPTSALIMIHHSRSSYMLSKPPRKPIKHLLVSG
jgi:hypothetical protein